jgi:hypothetical protein
MKVDIATGPNFQNRLEISVLGSPDVKKVIFSPWSVRTYVRTLRTYYRFKWEKVESSFNHVPLTSLLRRTQ